MHSVACDVLPNNTINPTVGVGLGADFVRTLAHRGLWWALGALEAHVHEVLRGALQKCTSKLRGARSCDSLRRETDFSYSPLWVDEHVSGSASWKGFTHPSRP
jgi:hypothetical protein